ncbi:MAG: sulfurtransferase complex subunit TusD [Gammaproteobacteria bacterium]|nr:sulfurtransferase complex subunit TusD [Gammaproteobacteria bacterium]
MKFAVLVNEGPYQHQAADSAYQFVSAALAAGHEVMRVFFYHDGVNNGSRLTTPPQDDRHIQQRWTDLASEQNVDLVLCVAACQRRGMVDDGERDRNGKDATNIAEGFRISGLGQLIEAGIEADRLITFGD